MVNRKAYMRTIEAFTAVVITFVFLIYVIPIYQGNEVRRDNLDIIDTAIGDEAIRDCSLRPSLGDASSCVELGLSGYMPLTYNYTVEVTSTPDFSPPEIKDKRVYSESGMIASNMTDYGPRYLRLYYWLE